MITYVTKAEAPLPGLGNANLAVGGLLISLGLVAGIVSIVLAIVGAGKRTGLPPTSR